jgi:predicted MFS family arabinose efflux permease
MPAWLAVNAVVGLWLTHAVFQMTAGREMEGQYLVGAFSSRTIAAILGGYTVTFGIGIMAWGYAFRWVSETTVMRIAMVAMLGATGSILLMNHSGGSGTLLWGGLALFTVSVLLESGFAPAAVSYLAALSSALKEDRGLMMGLYSVVLGLGQLLGGWVGGPLADRWGMDGILGLTAVLGAVALGLTLRLRQGSLAVDAP